MTAKTNTAAAATPKPGQAPASAPAAAAPTKVAAPKPAPANCRCGCGAPTVRDAALYLPGHDARHAGQVGRALIAGFATPEEAEAALATLPTPALQDKARGMVASHAARLTKKAASAEARKVAQAAAKAAYAEALAKAGLA